MADEEIKKANYHDMLMDSIWEFVSMSSFKTLEDMIAWAREHEIYLETVRKKKSVQAQVSYGSVTKYKVIDSQLRGQHGRGRYPKCRKAHDAVCRVGGFG